MANNLPRYSLLGSAECKKKKSTLPVAEIWWMI